MHKKLTKLWTRKKSKRKLHRKKQMIKNIMSLILEDESWDLAFTYIYTHQKISNMFEFLGECHRMKCLSRRILLVTQFRRMLFDYVYETSKYHVQFSENARDHLLDIYLQRSSCPIVELQTVFDRCEFEVKAKIRKACQI
jgi:hypothetical protein